jgi:hypothetical protein
MACVPVVGGSKKAARKYGTQRIGKLLLIAEWLDDMHPTPWPVWLAFTDECQDERGREIQAGTHRLQNKLVIELAMRRPRLPMCIIVDNLLHEWAHADQWRLHRQEKWVTPEDHHNAHWGLSYQKKYSEYTDQKLFDGWLRKRRLRGEATK